MVKLPIYEQQVQPDTAVIPSAPSNTGNPGLVLSSMNKNAEAVQGAASALGDVGQKLYAHAQKLQTLQLKKKNAEFDTQFRQELQDKLYSPESEIVKINGVDIERPVGIYNRSLKQAEGATSEFKEFYEASRQKYLSQVSDPEAQLALSSSMDNRYSSALDNVLSHESKQRREDLVNGFKSNIAQQIKDAANATDLASLTDSVNTAAATQRDLNEALGLDPATAKLAEQKTIADVIESSTSAALMKDMSGATSMKLLDAAKDVLDQKDYDELASGIKVKSKKILDETKANAKLGKNINSTKILMEVAGGNFNVFNVKELNRMANNGEISNEAATAAIRAIEKPISDYDIKPDDEAFMQRAKGIFEASNPADMEKNLIDVLDGFSSGSLSQERMTLLFQAAKGQGSEKANAYRDNFKKIAEWGKDAGVPLAYQAQFAKDYIEGINAGKDSVEAAEIAIKRATAAQNESAKDLTEYNTEPKENISFSDRVLTSPVMNTLFEGLTKFSQNRAVKNMGLTQAGFVEGVGGAASMVGLKNFGDSVSKEAKKMQKTFEITDPNIWDSLQQGLWAGVGFVAPGLGIAKAATLLKATPIIAASLGVGASSVLESGLEAGNNREEAKRRGMSDEEANRVGAVTFWLNMPVTVGGNVLGGVFNPAKQTAKKLTVGEIIKEVVMGGKRAAVAEGAQEGLQEVSSNVAIGDPLGQRVPEAVLIGTIVGKFLGVATSDVFNQTKAMENDAPADNTVKDKTGKPMSFNVEPGVENEVKVDPAIEKISQDIAVKKAVIAQAISGVETIENGGNSKEVALNSAIASNLELISGINSPEIKVEAAKSIDKAVYQYFMQSGMPKDEAATLSKQIYDASLSQKTAEGYKQALSEGLQAAIPTWRLTAPDSLSQQGGDLNGKSQEGKNGKEKALLNKQGADTSAPATPLSYNDIKELANRKDISDKDRDFLSKVLYGLRNFQNNDVADLILPKELKRIEKISGVNTAKEEVKFPTFNEYFKRTGGARGLSEGHNAKESYWEGVIKYFEEGDLSNGVPSKENIAEARNLIEKNSLSKERDLRRFDNAVSPKPPVSDLQKEALKYKTAEEFVKGQRPYTDDGNKYIVQQKGDYKIVVDNPEDATHITLWRNVEVKGRKYDKKVGTLSLSKGVVSPDGFLKVNSIEIDKSERGQGFGTEMYRVAMKYAKEGIKGIKSYTPDRINKKQVPSIYKRLGGTQEGDYQTIPIDNKTKSQLTAIWNEAHGQKVGKGTSFSESEKKDLNFISEVLSLSEGPQILVDDYGNYSRSKSGWPSFLSNMGYTAKQLQNIFAKIAENEPLTEKQTAIAKSILEDYNATKSNIESAEKAIDAELLALRSRFPEITDEEIRQLEAEIEKEEAWNDDKYQRAVEKYTAKKNRDSESQESVAPKEKRLNSESGQVILPGVDQAAEFIQKLADPELQEGIYQKGINRFQSLENAAEKAKSLALFGLPVGEDPGLSATRYLSIANQSDATLRAGVYNITPSGKVEILSEGLKPILNDYEKSSTEENEETRREELNKYLVARRTVQDLQRPKSETDAENIVTPEQVAKAQADLDALQSKYGSLDLFDQTAQRVYAYQKALLSKLVESGAMSKENFDKILSLNPNYVPFNRILPEDEPSIVTPKNKNRFSGARSPIKKIQGSELEIEDVIESIIKNTYRIMDVSARNKVFKDVYNLKDIDALGIKAIAPNMQPIGVTEKETGTDDITIFRPSQFKPKGNIVEGFINGKHKYLEVPKNMHDAMTGLDEVSSGLLIKILSQPTNWLRTGATITPEFIARNPIRDQWTALLQTHVGFRPFVDPGSAIADIFYKREIYNDWIRSGGAYASFVELSRPQVSKMANELLGRPDLMSKLNIINGLQNVSQLMEQATRLGVYKAGIRSGLSPLEAAKQSRESTLDFARRGSNTKDINSLIAFFNAGVQSFDKMVRTAKEDPVGMTTKALVSITLPSLLLYLKNRDEDDYKELPRWQKDLFWMTKINGTWVRIPKPFAFGQIFGSMPERFMEYLETKDPKALDNLAQSLYDSLSPVSGDPASGLLPTGIKPLLENEANWSFFRQRAIVPMGQERLLPKEQYTKYDTETSKVLGNILNISPSKIENLVSGYFGGSGRYVLQGGELFLDTVKKMRGEEVPQKLRELSDVPLVKGFVARDPVGGQSESVQDFYNTKKELNALNATFKKYNKDGDVKKADALLKSNPELEFSKVFDSAYEKMKNIDDRVEKITASNEATKEKKSKILELNKTKTVIAKDVLKSYQQFRGK